MMDKDFFDNQMTNLCNALWIDVGLVKKNKVYTNKIYNKFKGVTNERFVQIVDWLGDNMSYKTVPLPQEFIKAQKATFHEKEYEYDNKPYNSNPESEKLIKELIKKFSIKKDKVSQVQLLKKMYKEDKIYSIKLGRWINHSQEKDISGMFIHPEKQLKASGIKL